MADLLKTIVKDPEKLELKTELPAPDVVHSFIDVGGAGAGAKSIFKLFFMDDYRAANGKDTKLGAIMLAHVLKESHGFMVLHLHQKFPGGYPHELATEFESKVLSDLTGQKEQTRVESVLPAGTGIRLEYTSVAYDVYHKAYGPVPSNTIILVQDKKCRCKK